MDRVRSKRRGVSGIAMYQFMRSFTALYDCFDPPHRLPITRQPRNDVIEVPPLRVVSEQCLFTITQ